MSARNSWLCEPWHIWLNVLRAWSQGSLVIWSRAWRCTTFIGLMLSVWSKSDFSYTLAVSSLKLQNKMAAARHSLALLLLMDLCCLGDFWKMYVLKGLIYTWHKARVSNIILTAFMSTIFFNNVFIHLEKDWYSCLKWFPTLETCEYYNFTVSLR